MKAHTRLFVESFRRAKSDRELHRIPPLQHVLDLFPLVNLVNQFRGMIDEPHRRITRDTRPPQLPSASVNWMNQKGDFFLRYREAIVQLVQ